MVSKLAYLIIIMIQNSKSFTVQAPIHIHFDDYLKASLQSTGIMPEDKEYMTSFYERLYGDTTYKKREDEVEELCDCNGCFIYDTCLRCVSFKNCENINGTFCRD